MEKVYFFHYPFGLMDLMHFPKSLLKMIEMVKALFVIAEAHQPSVVFIDEVDSLLTARSETEHESSRRLKTEFLVQLDGTRTTGEERVLIIGATNRPWELDEAARRRFVKRLYIPLPGVEGREQLVRNFADSSDKSGADYELAREDILRIVRMTRGYSGADVVNVIKEASMFPLRDHFSIKDISKEQLRPIDFNDFTLALKSVRSSVSNTDMDQYIQWGKTFGTFEIVEEKEHEEEEDIKDCK